MSIYKPTWLYIKQHTKTKLKYFGKTTQDPLKYTGSGVYWNKHLKKHGKDSVKTLWVHLYDSEDELISDATAFSINHDIVRSTDWANLMEENGKTGGSTPVTIDRCLKISESKRGKPRSESLKEKLSNVHKSIEHKLAISKSKSSIWKIIKIDDGTEIIVEHIKSWCNDNNLSYDMVLRYAKNNKIYKNYLAIKLVSI